MKDLIFSSKKEFNKTMDDWVKSQGFTLFKEYISIYKLKPFKSPLNPSSYLEKPVKIDFDSLIKPYVENMKIWVREKDRKDIIFNRYGGSITPQDIKNIHKKRKLYGWSGFIYKITQIKDIYGNSVSDGLILVGLTTELFSQRWYWYQTDAFVELSNLKIHSLMREFETCGENLKIVHPIDLNGEGYLGIHHSFKYEIIEFCWSDNKLRRREKAWISYFRKKYPHRVVNISKGGGGGSLISIPRSVLIPLIAKGLWSPDISKIIEKKYNRKISKDVIAKRIREYWGSFERARRIFLKPILKKLMSDGYTATYLSENLFKTVDSHTVSKWCGEIFWKIPFKEKRKALIKERLENLIIRGYTSYEMDNEFNGVPWATIRKEYIPEWWGDLHSARIEIAKPTLAQMLTQNKDIIRIAQELNHDSLERTRYLISLCWNFKSEKCKWNTIMKFIEYINFNKLDKIRLLKLKYNDIKHDFASQNYSKFLNHYQKKPNMTLKDFTHLFPEESQSNFYYWKNKAKDQV